MKKILLFILAIIFTSSTAQAQWSYITTDAYAYGCPGYVCIAGPTTGYTFEISPFSFFGPTIPGSCGGAEFAVPAGIFSVTIKQTSTGNIVQSFDNIFVSQPPSCAMELQSPTIYPGCYNTYELLFYVGGLWCGGGTINVTKNGTFYTSFGFSDPTQIISGLTPGNYVIEANYFSCFDTIHVTINDICPKPDIGFSTTNISKTAARLNWGTKTCAVGYAVQYRPTGAALWSTKSISSNSGTKYIGGLSPGTAYQWRVRSKCNLNPWSGSSWSAIQSFNTLALKEGVSISEEQQNENISVFPNPVSSILNVVSEFEIAAGFEIVVTDINGKKMNVNFNQRDENQIQADVSGLINGIYQLSLSYNNNIYNQKIVVIK